MMKHTHICQTTNMIPVAVSARGGQTATQPGIQFSSLGIYKDKPESFWSERSAFASATKWPLNKALFLQSSAQDPVKLG